MIYFVPILTLFVQRSENPFYLGPLKIDVTQMKSIVYTFPYDIL